MGQSLKFKLFLFGVAVLVSLICVRTPAYAAAYSYDSSCTVTQGAGDCWKTDTVFLWSPTLFPGFALPSFRSQFPATATLNLTASSGFDASVRFSVPAIPLTASSAVVCAGTVMFDRSGGAGYSDCVNFNQGPGLFATYLGGLFDVSRPARYGSGWNEVSGGIYGAPYPVLGTWASNGAYDTPNTAADARGDVTRTCQFLWARFVWAESGAWYQQDLFFLGVADGHIYRCYKASMPASVVSATVPEGVIVWTAPSQIFNIAPANGAGDFGADFWNVGGGSQVTDTPYIGAAGSAIYSGVQADLVRASLLSVSPGIIESSPALIPEFAPWSPTDPDWQGIPQPEESSLTTLTAVDIDLDQPWWIPDLPWTYLEDGVTRLQRGIQSLSGLLWPVTFFSDLYDLSGE